MRYSFTLVALVAPFLVSAAPARFYGKRAATDVLVFKFADVLEQLESSFYEQAIAKFQESDFTAAGFSSSQVAVEQFKNIQIDEATHSTVLQTALKSMGEQPITGCKFNFAPALTDVATMAATARVVENVGVGAYLGGATLLTDPVLLSAAGSILTVEARHQTILNILSSSGTAIPSAFDIGFTPSEVLALAGPFFDGPCDVGIPSNPSLALTNSGVVGPGTKLTFSSSALNGTVSEDTMFCQMLIGDLPTSIPLPFSDCVVPDGINGPVAIFITSDGQALINNVHNRAQTQLIAGPALAFIDTQPQLLGQLARGGSASSPAATASASVSTRTISPEEASSILASASSSTADASVATPATTLVVPPAGSSSAATVSAASASATASSQNNSAFFVGSPGGPNSYVGPSPDGAVIINGWGTSA